MLSAYRASGYEIQNFKTHLSESREANSRSIVMPLSGGMSLRVYSKTNRRVRFEIVFSEINHGALLQQPKGTPGVPSPLRSCSDAIRCLAALREKGANELNSLFTYFRAQNRISPSHASPLAFIVSLSTVLRNTDLAHTVLSLLIQNGIIAPPEVDSELSVAIRALVDANLLRYYRRQGGYDAAPAYREPLSILRAFKPLQLLTTGRNRQRTAID